MTAIEYRDIGMDYGAGPVIQNFNLTVSEGEFLVVIGSSGSGKTTILKMANGLERPTQGEIYVKGRPLKDLDLIQLRRSIGYAIQGNVLFPHMTVEKNIAYVPNLLRGQDRNKIKADVNKWLDKMGLSRDLLKKFPRQLAGGQQQRVGIARALAASPSILLMDEPFSAVGGITRSELQDEIKQIQQKEGLTVMFVTHDVDEAFKIGGRILVMNKGEIQQCDTPEIIRKKPANDFVKMLAAKAAASCSDL